MENADNIYYRKRLTEANMLNGWNFLVVRRCFMFRRFVKRRGFYLPPFFPTFFHSVYGFIVLTSLHTFWKTNIANRLVRPSALYVKILIRYYFQIAYAKSALTSMHFSYPSSVCVIYQDYSVSLYGMVYAW